MNYLRLMVFIIVSPAAMATHMEGSGANYYLSAVPDTRYSTDKNLVPTVLVGDRLFIMEFNTLADIAKITGAVVNQDDKTSWLCLRFGEVNYWFISDSEMGHGDLTSIAISRDEKQKDCASYGGVLNVSVKNIPLLGATAEDLSRIFQKKPDGNAIEYCSDAKSYGDFTQTNCLQYYFENKSVAKILISQITTN